MKKFVLSFVAVGAFLVALSTSSPASADDNMELACKPVGASCHNSFECCGQNCQTVNGKETCH